MRRVGADRVGETVFPLLCLPQLSTGTEIYLLSEFELGRGRARLPDEWNGSRMDFSDPADGRSSTVTVTAHDHHSIPSSSGHPLGPDDISPLTSHPHTYHTHTPSSDQLSPHENAAANNWGVLATLGSIPSIALSSSFVVYYGVSNHNSIERTCQMLAECLRLLLKRDCRRLGLSTLANLLFGALGTLAGSAATVSLNDAPPSNWPSCLFRLSPFISSSMPPLPVSPYGASKM